MIFVAQIIYHSRAYTQQVTKHTFISLSRIIQRLNVFARNDQHMRRRLRINIANHHTTIILMNKLARNISCDDLAKQTIPL
jgi:hypothetical protein